MTGGGFPEPEGSQKTSLAATHLPGHTGLPAHSFGPQPASGSTATMPGVDALGGGSSGEHLSQTLPVAGAASDRPIGSDVTPDPGSLTTAQIKKWMCDHGHDNEVVRLKKGKA